MTLAENVLAHHGVKGMRWGVRKDGSTASTHVSTSKRARPASDVIVKQKPGKFVRTSGGTKHTASEEAIKTAASRQIAKKSTTDALSNKQLQDAVQRMNLEQQFHRLAKQSDRRSAGQKFIQGLLGNKQTRDQVATVAKQVSKEMAKRAATA